MALNPPPKKPKDVLPKADVSRFRIDDPTAAFPIGSLIDDDDDPQSLEGDAVKPLPEPGAAPAASSAAPPVTITKLESPSKAARAPAPPAATAQGAAPGGVNVQWLALSLLAGGGLAVVVVGLFGLMVMLARS